VSKAHHLLKDNLEILKRVFDIYKGHKEDIIRLFYCQTKELFREIEENESADGEDIWENKYFRCMIKTKVENVILKIESEKKKERIRSKGTIRTRERRIRTLPILPH